MLIVVVVLVVVVTADDDNVDALVDAVLLLIWLSVSNMPLITTFATAIAQTLWHSAS